MHLTWPQHSTTSGAHFQGSHICDLFLCFLVFLHLSVQALLQTFWQKKTSLLTVISFVVIKKKTQFSCFLCIKEIRKQRVCQHIVNKLFFILGTKGKGSTCAFVEAILRRRGYKTGFFSSPHLIAVRERIRINGSPIGKREFSSNFWDLFESLQAKMVGTVLN